MTLRAWKLSFIAGLAALMAVICLESWTDIDMQVQRLWFDKESGEWLISRAMFEETRWFWHRGAKKAVSAVAIVCSVLFVASFYTQKLRISSFYAQKLRAWRKCCLLLALSLALVPLVANTGKKVTNIYCPEQLTEFGGFYTYQRVLECKSPANEGMGHGRCFPAGHAAGGFAFMMLYFSLTNRRWRWAGLLFGLAAGWVLGNYQMVRGEHFLSHTLATMALAWVLDLLILLAVEYGCTRFNLDLPPPLLSFAKRNEP